MKRMHGHALLWHEAVPKWVADFSGDSLAWEGLVHDHIQTGVTIWNVGDGDSWIPKFCQCSDFPLPFDATYQKKPAYEGVLTGLSN